MEVEVQAIDLHCHPGDTLLWSAHGRHVCRAMPGKSVTDDQLTMMTAMGVWQHAVQPFRCSAGVHSDKRLACVNAQVDGLAEVLKGTQPNPISPSPRETDELKGFHYT